MLRTFVLCAILLFALPSAFAHNAAGHKIVADIAWQKLTPQQRQKIAAILREHPRFDEDFLDDMPPEVESASQDIQDHWIFCQASIWPDIVKSLPNPARAAFNRPRWHYINLPIFIDSTQADALLDGLTVNLSFDLPATGDDDEDDEAMYNGVQAVKHSLRVITTSTSSNAEKAVAYCWLLHVIPDLAQPLHSSAFFSENIFPGGDQGGNKITIRREGTSGGGQKLHSVWDGFLGKNSGFNEIRAKAQQYIAAHSTEFNAVADALPDDVWVTESHAIARTWAYGPIMADIVDAEQNDDSLGIIEVPSSYYSNSGNVMKQRGVIAGVRLAGVLATTVPSTVSPSHLTLRGSGTDLLRGLARRAPRTRRETPATASAAPQEVDIRELAERMERMEAELVRLRLLLERKEAASGATVRPARTPGRARTPRMPVVDDGEQCDCGLNE
jgi:hypothetical protein